MFEPLTYGKVQNYETLPNGGVIFHLVDNDATEFFLFDDASAQRLVTQRNIPGVEHVELQPIAEAISNLEGVKANSDLYLVVFSVSIFGITLYKLFASPVPGYAYFAFTDPIRTSSEKDLILSLTKTIESDGKIKLESNHKCIAVMDEKVVAQYFRSISEVHDYARETGARSYFAIHVGSFLTKPQRSTSYYRTTCSKRPIACGNNELNLFAPHFVPVEVSDSNGNIVHSAAYMIDDGADESSFPGCFYRISGDNMVFKALDGTELSIKKECVVEDEVQVAGSTAKVFRILSTFNIKVGELDAVQIDSLIAYSNPPSKQDPLLLGRDVLFRLHGSWFPDCNGNVQITLENAMSMEKVKSESLFQFFSSSVSSSVKKNNSSLLFNKLF